MSGLPKLITAKDLAEVLGEEVHTVRKHTRQGHYKSFSINIGTERQPRWRYDTVALAKWLESRRGGGW